jgi:DNA-binding MarR family transcriptional regulator
MSASQSLELAGELRLALSRLIRRVRVEGAFPLPHGTVLGRLDREGPQSVSDLAAGARMRPQSMAQTVGELEERGYVARRPDPNDKRRQFVELTPAGREALEADRAQRDGWMAETLDALGEDERAVLARAVRLIERIADA